MSGPAVEARIHRLGRWFWEVFLIVDGRGVNDLWAHEHGRAFYVRGGEQKALRVTKRRAERLRRQLAWEREPARTVRFPSLH